MSIYKRGKVYWYKFTFKGEAIRESTRQTNQRTARDMESAHRTSLAKGEVGIRDRQGGLCLRKAVAVPCTSPVRVSCRKIPITLIDFLIAGLPYLLRFERVDNLGAYSIPSGDRPSHPI